ncbi:bifunctional endoribonuclease/protein kinase ire1 [Thelotrema lepadinum]|nr:bifunctional endoribonuclease/protein kinase ire1 [Thelotrema lepadinum]
MSRQRPGAGTVSISKLTTYFLLLPLVLASPQQEQRRFQNSQNSVREDGHVDYQARSSSSIKAYEDGAALDTNDYKNLKDTIHDSAKASAIATLAPAPNSAVRAPRPVQGPGKTTGPSSLQIARSLQDWEVEDFILLATVDGSIHARDRNTGQERWALEVDRPMVETIYHQMNRSEIDDYRPDDDFLWIVEPSRDGDIYIYNQGRNPGLQRLRLTVKKLAEDFSPYAGEDPAVVYTTEKRTTLFTVDAATGAITKTFSSSGSTRNDDMICRRMNGLEGSDPEECGSSGTIMLGRTEYTVNIDRLDTGSPICTLRYSEWGPNNRDMDLHGKYDRTMDQKYVFPRFDGSIWGFDIDLNEKGKMRKRYVKSLPSPVVRVFDIARPVGSEGRDTQLVLLPQPIGPIDIADIYPTIEDRNRIFINQTDGGGWFAMSESKYPFATGGAAKAQCYNRDWLEAKFATETPSLEQRQAALIGVHSLSDTPVSGQLLTISGPQTDFGNETPGSMLPGPSPIGLLPGLKTSSRTANTVIDISVALFLMLLGALITVNRRSFIRFLRQNGELKRILPQHLEKKLDSVPSSPIVPQLSLKDLQISPTPKELKQETDGEATPTAPRAAPLLEPPPSGLRSRSSTLSEDRGRTKQSAPHVRILEPSRSPAPTEPDDEATEAIPEKRKARRGTRGGVKHKKKKGGLSNKAGDGKTVEETVEEAMQIGKEPSALEPDVLEVQGISKPSDPASPVIQIGHLRVFTNTTIGFGSHGTVVYKGTFGGRDVAVKRMLLEFYDIASHEVGLLQESDDHPNVIRYYDKESSGQFLYIALELCPASLQDVIDKPQGYSQLIGPTGLDLPDVLRQITAGLRYLHSLKIVHRDIKPQNILMSAPKKLPSNPTLFQPPRLLISDFGLCKKLEGDQSSFRATTAHAAGTTGWRAPELLVDDDASPNTTTQSGLSTTSDSEPLVLDTQTNRRATRSIDIFSLGCVFYFVLTGGSHPFDRDGRYMREPNVIKGHYSLDELARLGDYQWEARDLIASMIHHNPKSRPDAATVLAHPFFWAPQTRLDFLCSVSDAFEFEVRDPPSPALQALESLAPSLLKEHGNDFLRPLPQVFKDTLGKQRKYQGYRMLDLLRALRNKKNHYEDIPEGVKKMVGSLPGGYLGFWTRRFPGLLMGAHEVVRELGWTTKDRFRGFYEV